MYKISGGKFTYDVIAEFGVSNLNLKKKSCSNDGRKFWDVKTQNDVHFNFSELGGDNLHNSNHNNFVKSHF